MIYRLKEQKDKFIEKIYRESMRDLNRFYNIGWTYGRPRVVITGSRKEIDKLRDAKTEPWMVGWSESKAVYILDRKKLEKESDHKYTKETYTALLKHEISHAFFFILSKGKYNPMWLCEGVAIYTSGQNKFKKVPNKFETFLNYYDNGGRGIYHESGFAIQVLVKKYGKEKLLKLISGLGIVKNKNDFSRLFNKIYGFSPNYKNFNSLLGKFKW